MIHKKGDIVKLAESVTHAYFDLALSDNFRVRFSKYLQ